MTLLMELSLQEINYSKTTFGPMMSGLHKHTKLMEAESVTFNENKLIQEWVDEEIKYPYTPLNLGNRKYKQTIAKTGFTEEVIAELMKRRFTHTQVDRHIKEIRHRFGFDVQRSGSKRGKHTPPAKLPEIIFTEEKVELCLSPQVQQFPQPAVQHLLHPPLVDLLLQWEKVQRPQKLWKRPLAE